jgi:hypothetical protein
MGRNSLFASVALSLLCVFVTQATVVPTLGLDRLTTEASLIAVGRITLVRRVEKTAVQFGDRTLPAWAMLAELHVDRVLKDTAKGFPSS